MNDFSPYCTVEQASELIACCLAKNVPFYICRYPGGELCRVGVQLQGHPKQGAHDGFRVVPFDTDGDSMPFTIIPDAVVPDKAQLDAHPRLDVEPSQLQGEDVTQEEYLRQANSLIERMRQGEMSKVVLSRTITRSCDTAKMLPRYYARLCVMYPHAYVFVVSYPGVCGWVGATPEVLLRSTQQGYATMALAGTRKAGGVTAWGDKEIDEQQYVARYIARILEKEKDIRVEDRTETLRAGQVEHLCTHFDITTHPDAALRDRLVGAFHPTPAVAGTPTADAMQAIGLTEGRSRRYYGGYVGESLSDGRCALYVNLRSMEFTADAVRLYVGGGLTAHSVAQDEWNETCAKAQTMLSAFQDK
ncbi:MAG: chorismate-binding protein [Bacteroidaceae bacterium]|nr:chorismate-binding protein [Bacteroidaceae bacterium]